MGLEVWGATPWRRLAVPMRWPLCTSPLPGLGSTTPEAPPQRQVGGIEGRCSCGFVVRPLPKKQSHSPQGDLPLPNLPGDLTCREGDRGKYRSSGSLLSGWRLAVRWVVIEFHGQGLGHPEGPIRPPPLRLHQRQWRRAAHLVRKHWLCVSPVPSGVPCIPGVLAAGGAPAREGTRCSEDPSPSLSPCDCKPTSPCFRGGDTPCSPPPK